MFFDKKFICLWPLLVYNIRENNINKPAREKARAQNKLNKTKTNRTKLNEKRTRPNENKANLSETEQETSRTSERTRRENENRRTETSGTEQAGTNGTASELKQATNGRNETN